MKFCTPPSIITRLKIWIMLRTLPIQDKTDFYLTGGWAHFVADQGIRYSAREVNRHIMHFMRDIHSDAQSVMWSARVTSVQKGIPNITAGLLHIGCKIEHSDRSYSSTKIVIGRISKQQFVGCVIADTHPGHCSIEDMGAYQKRQQ